MEQKTLELVLDRRWPRDTYSIGIMYVDDVRFSETLEDPDRGLTSDMPVNKIKRIKIKGQTAIPKGRYEIDMNTVSPRFKGRAWAKKYGGIVPRLLAVPCWSGALIHPLNKASETEGCIGVGENKVKGQIINSVATFYKLMDNYLWPAKLRGERIFITVK